MGWPRLTAAEHFSAIAELAEWMEAVNVEGPVVGERLDCMVTRVAAASTRHAIDAMNQLRQGQR